MNDEAVDAIMNGTVEFGSLTDDPNAHVLKHHTTKKKEEVEAKLRASLAADLINVR